MTIDPTAAPDTEYASYPSLVDRTVLVDAGVTLSALNEALQPHGLFFPIDLGADPPARLLDLARQPDVFHECADQVRAQDQFLEVAIHTTCTHCGEAIEIVVDSELNHRIVRGGQGLLVFEPEVEWSEFDDPTIVDGN